MSAALFASTEDDCDNKYKVEVSFVQLYNEQVRTCQQREMYVGWSVGHLGR